MSSGANSRVLSAASLSSSFQHIAPDRHSEANNSSGESFGSISDATSSDDDEIVWSVSDELSASVLSAPSVANGLRSPDVFSDEEFIVLSRPSAPSSDARASHSGLSSMSESGVDISSIDGLSDVMSNLNIESSDVESARPISQATSRSPLRRSSRIRAMAMAASPATAPAPAAATPRANKAKAKKAKAKAKSEGAKTPASTPKKKRVKKATLAQSQPGSPVIVETPTTEGLGERPIVDDVSEAGDAKVATAYDEAAQYISSFLAETPSEVKAKSNLTFLQALIVELGVLPTQQNTSASSRQPFFQLPALPRSLRAAKALLKTNVFLNVRDYLDTREKGLEALRKVMHPSRQALVKDLTRGKGKRKVPRGFIKKSGLGVLLVTCYN